MYNKFACILYVSGRRSAAIFNSLHNESHMVEKWIPNVP